MVTKPKSSYTNEFAQGTMRDANILVAGLILEYCTTETLSVTVS